MMSDKLKQFIHENREAFDAADPDPELLKALKKKLTGNNKIRKSGSWKTFQWAAAVSGIVIVSAIIYSAFQKMNPGDNDIVKTEEKPGEITAISDPVYTKQIDHFKEMIGLQQTELKQVEKEQPVLYHQFAADIYKLDSAYSVLKTKLTENPNREMLLEAMIQNLQLQSGLLNQQLKIIKEIKQKSKSHEKTTI